MQVIFFPDRGSILVRWTGISALYRVAKKAGLYHAAVQVCYIPIPGDTYDNLLCNEAMLSLVYLWYVSKHFQLYE